MFLFQYHRKLKKDQLENEKYQKISLDTGVPNNTPLGYLVFLNLKILSKLDHCG